MPEIVQNVTKAAQYPVVQRLLSSVLLTEEEMEFLDGLHINRARYKKGETLIAENDDFQVCFAVISGWGITFDITPSGQRQIIGITLPGDLEGIHINFDRVSAYTIIALTDMEVALIEPARLIEIQQKYPILASGLDWAAVGSFNILSERNVSLGARDADQRILHFLLEMWCRLMLIGQASSEGFELIMTQEQLGDTLGLSVVHTNKMLKRLRGKDLLAVSKQSISFPKLREAIMFADFNPRYLNPTQKQLISAGDKTTSPSEQIAEMQERMSDRR